MKTKWTMAATILLAAFLGLAGCEGDDGKDGAPGVGTDGDDGISCWDLNGNGVADPEEDVNNDGVVDALDCQGPGIVTLPLETCAVCHGEGSFASAPAAHEIDREISYTVLTPPTADGDDLVVAFDIRVNGAPYDFLTLVQRTVIFQGIDGEYTRNQLPNNSHTFLESVVNGVYTFRIPGGTLLNGVPVNPSDFVGTDARIYFRLNSPAGVTPARRASVNADDAAYARLDLVSDQSCKNCHGEFAGGLTSHHYNPFDASNCIACHSAVNPPGGIGMTYLTHGIHNSQNLPGGEIDIEGQIFKITYPTYMANCSVCHDEPATLAAANAMPVTAPGCFSCHGSIEGFGFAAGNFHLALPNEDCLACHVTNGVGSAAGITVADFHNGAPTGNAGLIWDGADVSVTEGEKFAWTIDSVVDDGTELAISWTATYNGVAVDPCNATVGVDAPVFHVPGGGSGGGFSMLRSYAQGDDFIIGTSTSAPGQADAVNLSAANTTCSGLVATTVIPVDDVDATVGRVALQGKPGVVSPASATALLRVRVPTPTFDWLLGSDDPAPARRAVVETAECLKCHVGSLYQHGGNRVDNVDMCILCHNSASNEQSVRVGMGVEASEAYDGKVGETFEMKTMLHRIHSAGTSSIAGADTSPLYVIYRNRGIYAWAPDESFLPDTWPGTGPQIVFGSNDVTQNHNFHAPTYPRALNACTACHAEGFAVMPDQTKAMATTVNAGSTAWGNQLDDTLQGAATTACITCHSGGPVKGHAYQNSWVPQVFPEGRETIIEAVR
jgi:OmcA/MtrC family decaheme c-type cytochrome